MQKLNLQNLDGINVEPPFGYILLKEKPKMKILIKRKNLDNHYERLHEVFS
jgi:hypothetical protein